MCKIIKVWDNKGGLVCVQLFEVRDIFFYVGRIVDDHTIEFILWLTMLANTTGTVLIRNVSRFQFDMKQKKNNSINTIYYHILTKLIIRTQHEVGMY